MHVPLTILETINTLRSRYITILLTGNMDSFTRFTQPELKLERYFDLISNSFDERQNKTDNNGELFLKYTKKYNAHIQDCVVIDDSHTVHKVFTELGGIAYLVTPDHSISSYLHEL